MVVVTDLFGEGFVLRGEGKVLKTWKKLSPRQTI
jgi:hypothetical protein